MFLNESLTVASGSPSGGSGWGNLSFSSGTMPRKIDSCQMCRLHEDVDGVNSRVLSWSAVRS